MRLVRKCWPTSSAWRRKKRKQRERAINPREPIWTRKARADLFEDYVYIAKYNPSAADAFVLDMEDKLRSIAQLGLTGSNRGDLRRGLRAIPYRQRILFFTVDDRHLTVMRVLHSHQNITSDDFTESSS